MNDPGDLVVHCETPADVWHAVDVVLSQLPEEQGRPLKRLKNECHSQYVTAQRIAKDAALSLFLQVNNRSVTAILEDLAEAERQALGSDGLVTTYHYDGSGQKVDPHSDSPSAD